MNSASSVQTLIRDHGPLLSRRDVPVPSSTLSRAVAAGELVAVLPGSYLAAPIAHHLPWRVAAIGRWNPDAVVFGPAAAALTFWSLLSVPTIDVAARTTTKRPLAQLWSAFGATTGRDGNGDRRKLLLDSRAAPWSEAERLAHRLLRPAGIRGWSANHRVVFGGVVVRYIDVAFVGIRLAVEIDGYQFHSDPESFETDRIRHNELVENGWTVLRFTYKMLVDDPQRFVELVRGMVGSLRCVSR